MVYDGAVEEIPPPVVESTTESEGSGTEDPVEPQADIAEAEPVPKPSFSYRLHQALDVVNGTSEVFAVVNQIAKSIEDWINIGVYATIRVVVLPGLEVRVVVLASKEAIDDPVSGNGVRDTLMTMQDVEGGFPVKVWFFGNKTHETCASVVELQDYVLSKLAEPGLRNRIHCYREMAQVYRNM